MPAPPIVIDDRAGTTDEALVLRAQRGSLDSFAEIVARFEGRMFNFIMRRLGGGRSRHADAEDLTQETFLRAWRSIADYQPQHRFSTWLFTIASRLVIDHLRHQQVRSAAGDALQHAALQREAALDPTGDERTAHAAGSELWAVAARILTEEQHAALWLRYAEDLAPGEVARVLNRTEVSVRVMLFRARQTLAPYAGQSSDNQNQQDGRCARRWIAQPT